MNMVRLIYTLILMSSVPVAMFLIIYSYKRRTIPGAVYFILTMICAILYSVTYIGEINSDRISSAVFWFSLEHIPIPIQHYLWLIMSLEYVGIPKKQLRLFKYIMLYHPIAYILIYFTNPIHHLYISSVSFHSNGYFPVLYTVKGPLFYAMVLSGTLIGTISVIYYIYGFMKAPRLQRGGHVIMLVASVFPWAAVYLNAAGIASLEIDYFPVLSIISGLLYAFGMFHYRIFNAVTIATEIAFRKSKEGIMLIDRSDHIIDVNDVLLELYPELSRLSKRNTLSWLIQRYPEFTKLGEKSNKLQYQLTGKDGIRHYTAELTEILAEDGRLVIGKILTVEDISLFIEHQKRLESIASDAIIKAESNELSFLQAQIKPHFLNNTLSVIGSMITRSPGEAKVLIAELGEHLANCYYVDNASPMITLEKELESVNTYVSIEKARFRERLNFHMECQHIPQIMIPRLVIQPLVENAIRHGILKKAETGDVWLIISEDDDCVLFEVKDNGVGMTEKMVQKLLHENGIPNSIGISNINKRLCRYYGKGLEIISQPNRGTLIQFYIPRISTIDRGEGL